MSQVADAPHESHGRWKWDEWGRGPYQALSKVMLGPPYEGYLEFTTEIDGEPWFIKVKYSKSGFAPAESDPIDAPRLYEWDIIGRGPGESKSTYNISPRFTDMRHWETGEPVNLPWENQFGETEGVDVEYKPSNVTPERALELLPEFFQAIFAEAGEPVYREYFREPPHPEYSREWAHERYVRARREWAERMAQSGVLQKITHHLADTEGVKMTLDIDNEEVVNHQNRLTLPPSAVSELFPGHSYGRKFEIYLLADPDAVSKDHPSYHPKVEVLVNQSFNDGESWAWAERQKVVEEIEETLMNFLAWEDIPLNPDGSGVYVADDHFAAETREKPVEIYQDPTPGLEAKSDHLLVTTLREMGDTAEEVAGTIATDGGQRVGDLADTLGKHPATIYRAIQELGELVELDSGHVSYRARKFQEEIRALVESAEYAIESTADRLQQVMHLAEHVADVSPFQQWVAEYGAEMRYDDKTGDPETLRIDGILSWLKTSSYESVQAAARQAIEKWRHSGNDPAVIRGAIIKWQTPDGGTETGYIGAVADR
ncbi:hypothetical protein Halru_2797 [Halovivax ruber XH-70]|uniref:DUF7845 domain-containing protein n=1 Tax=Halovivax ruber (strain DSM 18193 / JCM 13892 / XH-70) TaxID=797302 RepID=L0IEW3_HALRX|nr:hypothetical protein [Halovivax ruber]AGB17368.1 hypothetical protein Halru_2797 [Halovivax ruber XH-70]